jgi:hypothetical protein
VELAERHEVFGASAGRRGGRRLDLSVRKPAGGYRLERGYRTTAIPLRPAWKAEGRIGCTVPAPRPSARPWDGLEPLVQLILVKIRRLVGGLVFVGELSYVLPTEAGERALDARALGGQQLPGAVGFHAFDPIPRPRA